MGEEPWRVHRAGAPSLDHLRRSALLDRAALEARLNVQLTPPTIVAAWHPVTILRDTNAEADAFFAALEGAAGQIIFVYPNADAGGLALIEHARVLAARRAASERKERATLAREQSEKCVFHRSVSFPVAA